MASIKSIFSFLALVVGVYLSNIFFNFVKLPKFLLSIQNIIIGFGGILLILYGLNSLMFKPRRKVKTSLV